MKKHLTFSYSMVTYLLSIGTLVFLILWVFPFSFSPFYIDNGSSSSVNSIQNIFINIGLILLFGLQHSLMARNFFKEKVLKSFSIANRASTYSLFSAICLIILFSFWQPISEYVWYFDGDFAYFTFLILFLTAWSIAFLATFAIDHFELFGLHQGYRVLKNLPEPKITFQKKWFYKYVRHPIQAGTILGIWLTPTMSYGHFLFSFGFTIYIFIGLYLEEKSLVKEIGIEYEKYQEEVPMLLARLPRT